MEQLQAQLKPNLQRTMARNYSLPLKDNYPKGSLLEEPAKSDADKTFWTTTNNEAHSSRTYQLIEYL